MLDGNRAAEELIGSEHEQRIGESLLPLTVLPMDQLPKAAELLSKSIQERATGPAELRQSAIPSRQSAIGSPHARHLAPADHRMTAHAMPGDRAAWPRAWTATSPSRSGRVSCFEIIERLTAASPVRQRDTAHDSEMPIGRPA